MTITQLDWHSITVLYPEWFNQHWSWLDPAHARDLLDLGVLSLDCYMAGLFYHPNPCLYWQAVAEFEPDDNPFSALEPEFVDA